MSYREELQKIRQHAGTGFKRTGDGAGYVKFVEEQAAQEDAKEQAIVNRVNQTARELAKAQRLEAVRAERRRLQLEPTPEVYSVIPRMSIDDIEPGTTNEQVITAIKEAFRIFKERVSIEPADYRLLIAFCEQNEIDCRDPQIIERALQFIVDRLTLIEQGGPIPEPVTPEPVVEAPKNPYRYDDSPRSAYATWEREQANKELWAELTVPVRAWLTEIVQFDDKDLSGENVEALMRVMKAKNVAFTRETVRRQFLDLWGIEMNESSRREAFTREELAAWETDRADSLLSSEQLKAKYRNKVGF